ncbi:hypothetical protein TWF694_006554 [Orbilia ellipsospora]|uniref:Uncharacterized protein n=1 Tax=Orbilia ellipsospora TaxID=2528407 RepID=A0AAV9XLE4_9PEZI
MTERQASAAAAAAAIRRQSFLSLKAPESPRLSPFPATPSRSIQSSRAPSRTGSFRSGVPARVSELRSIREVENVTTSTNYPVRLIGRMKRATSTMSARPNYGVARSASVNKIRQGSMSYLRRTQSLILPGENNVFEESSPRLERKPSFMPASCRPGRAPAPPMLRTLRDLDFLGSRRPSAFGRRGLRFPSLRIGIFSKAKELGRRVSQSFRRPRHTPLGFPIQQVHSGNKHYRYEPSQTASDYSYMEESQCTDTVVHNPVLENRSYVTTLDHHDTEYFPQMPSPDRSVTTAIHVDTSVDESSLEPQDKSRNRGLVPSHPPTDPSEVDSRGVYNDLMKSLTKRFTEAPPQETVSEEPQEPFPRRVSYENARPSNVKHTIEKSLETRKPLSEIPHRLTNAVIEEEEEVDLEAPIVNANGSKSILVRAEDPDTSIFSQMGPQHNVWQDETTEAEAALAALRRLNLSSMDNSDEGASVHAAEYSKLIRLYQERGNPSTLEDQIGGLRSISGRLQENKGKDGDVNMEVGNSKGKQLEVVDPAFL